MKFFITLCAFILANLTITFAQEYTFFYGAECTHCAKVETYFAEHGTIEQHTIKMVETWHDSVGAASFAQALKTLNVDPREAGVPFLTLSGGMCYYIGDEPIINYFSALQQGKQPDEAPICVDTTSISQKSFWEKVLWTIGLALGDSFNPCEFVIIIIILVTILTKTGSRTKALLAGLLFSIGLGSVYYIFGLGVARLTAEFSWLFKYIVGGLAILIGLANFKDVFRYGKGFVMEVPFSWRPRMKAMLSKVTSPRGAFGAGILVSVFLAPCSGGPLVVYSSLMGGLAQGNEYRWFLLFYTLIFILPMLVITVLLSFGIVDAKAINKRKENNTTLMHIIVGTIMLGLGLYVFRLM